MSSDNPDRGEPIRLELTAKRVGAEPDSLSDARCCKTRVNWHQPEPDFPGNLLGTCSKCGAWYVVGQLRGEPEEILLRLPVNDLVLTGSFPA